MTRGADDFSPMAAEYAAFRPTYPEQLFATLADLVPTRHRAWDCATGSGQAARGLAAHFTQVIATDSSEAQLAHAVPHRRVEYRLAPAEASGLGTASVDLVTVAQALHWFAGPAFCHEVRRVLVPHGVLAAWCYGLLSVGPELDPILHRFYRHTLGAYWQPERTLVDAGYRTIDFPLAELHLPMGGMTSYLDLDSLAGYLRTWSAVRRYRAARQQDPVPLVLAELRGVWGDRTIVREVHWPLHLRAGRIQSPA